MKKRVFIFIVFFALLSILVFALNLRTTVKAEWFNDAWGYRQAIRFTNGGAAVSDQKVLIQFATNTPIAANKLQSSCQDVRFTDSAGKLLQYYINTAGGAGVGCNDASSDFYVLMPTIVAGDNLIYIYYGNPAAPAGTVSANFGNTTFSPSAGPTAASEETTPGAIAYWKFDENQGNTAGDTTGHGNSLTLASTAWATQSASLSNRTTYLQFNGSTSVASRANDTDFDFGTGSFSISGWFKHASTASFTDILITKYNTQGWKVYMNSSGFVCFGIDDDSTWGPDDSACSTTSYADSKWHHIEAVKSTTTSITLYVDGTQVAQTTSLTATSTLSTTATLYVGVDSAGTTNWWDGSVDDLAIYPYARSTAQVKSDFSGVHTAAIMGAQSNDALSNGLVGYWKMDENTGTSVTDYSGNGNTGSFTNSPTWGPGRFGTGVTFSDATTNKYITVPASASINNMSEFTYSMWVNPSQQQDREIFNKGAGVELYFENISSSVRTQFYMSCSGTNLSMFSTSEDDLIVNAWHHIVLVWDGKGCGLSNVQLYLDGKQSHVHANSDSGSGTRSADSSSALQIGNYTDNVSQLRGSMDDFRVYNRALQQSEVRQLYAWAPGPVGYWKMDENTGTSTTADSSGNGYSGTMTNLTNAWRQGKYSSALNFNGTNSRIQASGVSLPTGDFTYSAWIKPSAFATSNSIFGAPQASVGGHELFIDTDTDGDIDVIVDNGTLVINGTNGLITANTWSHISVTRSGSVVTSYINGVVDKTGTSATTLDFAPCGVSIGASHSSTTCSAGFGNYFQGGIDDARIYAYARTPSQIIEDMNGGHPPAGSPVGSSIIHWKFDEAYGATANNSGYLASTGNGAISGATWYSAGKVGSGIATTTSTNFINAGDQTFVDNLTGLTTGFWVKPVALATNKALISKSNMSTQNSFAVVTDNAASDEIRVHVPTSVSDVGTYFLTSNLDLAIDTWSYIDVVYNASESASTRVRVYKDGKEISGSVTGTLPDKMTTGTTSLLKVGASDSGSYTALNAVFDDVKVYPYPLTYDQMLIDFNGKNSMVLGSLSTHSDGLTASSSASREFCVPGDASSCSFPVGWWKMDENAGTTSTYDSSGNGNTGAMTNVELNDWKKGKVGSALNFDNLNNIINAGSSSSIDDIPATGVSFSVWLYLRSNGEGGSNGRILEKITTGDAQGYKLFFGSTSGRPELFADFDGAANLNVNALSTFSMNAWHHLEVTWDGSTSASNVKFYLDGVLSANNSATSGVGNRVSDASQSLYIGNSSDGAHTFDGYIDDVKIYNYVRTPAQIAWEYNRGAPVAVYRFDECQGSVAYNGAPTATGQAAGMNGTITIGPSGTYTSAGSCGSGVTTESWNGGTTGKYGSALAIDASNDYAAVADTSALDFTTSMTVASWVYSSVLPTTSVKDANIVNKYVTTGNQRAYKLIIDKGDNKYYFIVDGDGASGSTASAVSDVTFTTGVWHHVVGVFQNSTAYIYVDGVLQSTTSNQGFSSIFNSTADVVIGMDANKTSPPNSGLYDDVMLFNYALTGTQIKLLYNQGSAVRFGP